MECDKQGACSVKAEHIDTEISNSLEHIRTQKELALSGVKIYASVVFGIFVYAAFIQTNIKPIQNATFSFYAVIGVAITIFVFFLGWVLLDFITNTIFAAVVHYKHVSHMRGLKAITVGEAFRANCILPIATKEVPLKHARHLPITFSVINLLLLCACYYFAALAIRPSLAASYTMLGIGFFAYWYPNVFSKYNEEIFVAQLMSPGRDEKRIRKTLRAYVQRNERKKVHKILHGIMLFAFAFFLFSIGIGLYLFYEESQEISNNRNWFSLCLLLLVFVLRYFLAQFRVEMEGSSNVYKLQQVRIPDGDILRSGQRNRRALTRVRRTP